MTIHTQHTYPIPGCDHQIKEFHVVIYPAELREERYDTFRKAQEMAKAEAKEDVSMVAMQNYSLWIAVVYQRVSDIKEVNVMREELAVMA